MIYKQLGVDDYIKLWNLMNNIDNETDFMLFEPNERKEKSSKEILKNRIRSGILNDDFLMGAFENDELVGYISAEKGRFKRVLHKAYIVIGILNDYQNKKIGTNLFKNLEDWAKKQNIKRLELTVEKDNIRAVKLYKNCGFEIEGVAKYAMIVNGQYRDEYYMSKIIRD